MRDEQLREVIRAQSEIASSASSLFDVMQVITRRAQELVGGDGAVVELAEGEEMVYRAVSGIADGTLGLRLQREGSLSGLCVESGQVLITKDSETDPRVDREACRRVGLRSMVVVPLEYGGETLGVLKVLSARAETFDAADGELLQLLSGLIGASVGQARTYDSASSQAAQFAYMATHDYLTGLPNRALLFDRLRFLFARTRRTDEQLGLLVLDVDRFREINGRAGHHAGDEAIRWVAERLKGKVRGSDLAARLGGDELAIAMSPPVKEKGAAAMARRFAQLTRGELALGDERIPISTSVGFALSAEDVSDPETLLQAAERAMCEARGRGD